MRASRALTLAAFGVWLVFVVGVGFPLALGRHFHVDEFQLAYGAALNGVHHEPGLMNYVTPSLVPLGRLVALFDRTAGMLAALRAVYFLQFIALLLACAWAQPYFRSSRGRLAVLCIVTLFHPLWFHGFELRGDTSVALGAVLLFGLTHRAREGMATVGYVAGGVIAIGMAFASTKSFMYWGPLSLALVTTGGLRKSVPFVVGVVVGVAANIGTLAVDGLAGSYVANLVAISHSVAIARPFSPMPELHRVILDAPFIFVLAAVDAVVVAIGLSRARSDHRSIFTSGYFLWTVASLFINPAPWPYNILHVGPFAVFAALDLAAYVRRYQRWRLGAPALAIAAMLMGLGFAHAMSNHPYVTRQNQVQLSYIAAAESLAGPRDTVLDAVGMVLTRKPPDRDWILIYRSMPDYHAGLRKTFGRILEESAPPVLIDNFRWTWLPAEDLALRDARYVAMQPSLYTLGQRLPSGAGTFVVYRAGRYMIAGARVDGASGVVELAKGNHDYVVDDAGVVYWLGPNGATRPPEVMPMVFTGQKLFMNVPAER